MKTPSDFLVFVPSLSVWYFVMWSPSLQLGCEKPRASRTCRVRMNRTGYPTKLIWRTLPYPQAPGIGTPFLLNTRTPPPVHRNTCLSSRLWYTTNGIHIYISHSKKLLKIFCMKLFLTISHSYYHREHGYLLPSFVFNSHYSHGFLLDSHYSNDLTLLEWKGVIQMNELY